MYLEFYTILDIFMVRCYFPGSLLLSESNICMHKRSPATYSIKLYFKKKQVLGILILAVLFFRFYVILFVSVCVCVCICTCGCQKRMSDSLELVLKVVLRHLMQVLGIELQLHAFKCRAIFLQPLSFYFFFFHRHLSDLWGVLLFFFIYNFQ